MELENPNSLTIALSAGRGILNGHAVINDLTEAKAIILKITQYSNEIKTYNTEDLIITENSVTVPGGIKSGQGFDIELKLMNSVCTYIARAKGITIEPYTNQVINLTIEKAKPHIILTAGMNSAKIKFYAVPNPEKKDGLCFYSELTFTETGQTPEFGFDKYGRFLFIRKGASTTTELGVHSFTKSLRIPISGTSLGSAFCIDSENDELYYFINKKIFKRNFEWETFGKPVEGVDISAFSGRVNRIDEMSVGTHYLVLKTFDVQPGTNTKYRLLCLNKNDLTKVISDIDLFVYPTGVSVSGGTDVIVDGDLAYVICSQFRSGSYITNTYINQMNIYSLPDFKLIKTVKGFTKPQSFICKRDGKLYIADQNAKSGGKKRLGIYDTITGKLKFIYTDEFHTGIKFGW